MEKKEWDIFISHASEDKETIVRPIAQLLANFGTKVWYDEFSLDVGDSLSRSIDKGLANSHFGLVVLSPSFLQKDWPDYELRGLNAKGLGREKGILPIWHNVSRDDILSFSPTLADVFALNTNEHKPQEIALRILSIVRPDILDYIHARLAYLKALGKGKKRRVEVGKIKPSPIRHTELPDDLIGRIRLIRSALIVPYPQTMEFWVDGFKRDMQPEREIKFWEHVASCYLEYTAINKLTKEQHKAAFTFIVGRLMGVKEEGVGKLPPETIESLHDMCISKFPIYEIEGFPKSIEEDIGIPTDGLEKLRTAYFEKKDQN